MTFLAINEPFNRYGCHDVLAADIERTALVGTLKGVDTRALLGLSFADPKVSLATRIKRDASWER